jgi:hypothetical protein
MAREAAGKLNAGSDPQSLMNVTPVDIASSSDTYLIVVDSNGALLASSAQLDGRAVIPPSGVFVRDHGEDVISGNRLPASCSASSIAPGSYVVRSFGVTARARGSSSAELRLCSGRRPVFDGGHQLPARRPQLAVCGKEKAPRLSPPRKGVCYVNHSAVRPERGRRPGG